MEEDDKVCLCFGVTRRQLEKFIRLEKPVRHSQLSECYGAGTGCGWCRSFLQEMFDRSVDASGAQDSWQAMNAEEYAEKRREYRQSKSESSE